MPPNLEIRLSSVIERIGPTHSEWINELFRDPSRGKRMFRAEKLEKS